MFSSCKSEILHPVKNISPFFSPPAPANHHSTVSINLTTALSSVAQSCPTLCDLMDCSTAGLPLHHQLPELAQTHVDRVGDGCHPTISSFVVPFSSFLQSFPASGSLPRRQFFTSGGQSIGASASTSVLSMNTQD